MNPKRTPPTALLDNLDYLQRDKRIQWPCRGAQKDYQLTVDFLLSYNGSQATFNAYRREIERLLQWSWLIKGQSVRLLNRSDIEAFIVFCQNPPVAWTGEHTLPRFKVTNGQRTVNKAWRPFVSNAGKLKTKKKPFLLSQTSVRAIFSILSSYYNYLMQEGAIDSNPVLLIRQKSKFIQKEQQRAPVRRISNLQWDYVIETAECLAQGTPEEHERTLFIMKCLYAMYLRVSELVADERATPVMSDFRKDTDGHWWFHVTGKGNKNRIVTVSNDMLAALKRYRKHLGLSALPLPGEQTPLVPKILGQGPVTSTRQIRKIVQQCFDGAYQWMIDDGLKDDAAELKVATVHWLRHTGISEDVKTRPREHVRDDAGHASMQTTDRYIDSDLRERHASGKKKQIRSI